MITEDDLEMWRKSPLRVFFFISRSVSAQTTFVRKKCHNKCFFFFLWNRKKNVFAHQFLPVILAQSAVPSGTAAKKGVGGGGFGGDGSETGAGRVGGDGGDGGSGESEQNGIAFAATAATDARRRFGGGGGGRGVSTGFTVH